MARPKKEQWITVREAAALLRKNSGREDIPDSYVRSLVRAGKVQSRKLDGRTNGYLKRDIEAYVVRKRTRDKGDAEVARE